MYDVCDGSLKRFKIYAFRETGCYETCLNRAEYNSRVEFHVGIQIRDGPFESDRDGVFCTKVGYPFFVGNRYSHGLFYDKYGKSESDCLDDEHASKSFGKIKERKEYNLSKDG